MVAEGIDGDPCDSVPDFDGRLALASVMAIFQHLSLCVDIVGSNDPSCWHLGQPGTLGSDPE